MELNELSRYRRIVVQCHDHPDADAIGAGFALQRYFASRGVVARLVYGGRAAVTKPNLVWLLRLLSIPLEHIAEAPDCDLLITVDCQYGAGNVTRFAAPATAVIDHHRQECDCSRYAEIRPSLGSCATLVWDLLRRAGFDFASQPHVYTALYYGLYTDTKCMAEMHHPLDRDMAEFMPYDRAVIKQLKKSVLTVQELAIVAKVLRAPWIHQRIAVMESEPCDPNILGFAIDIAEQADEIDCCVVYCVLEHGVKFSVRSCVREIMADEFASYLAWDVGSGGGTPEKAGGFLPLSQAASCVPRFCASVFFRERVQRYAELYDHVYSGAHALRPETMELYEKLRLPQGYAKSAEVFAPGTPLTVRTLEGDVDIDASEDVYLMIGILGEVYPIRREKFQHSYAEESAKYSLRTEYLPTVINRIDGARRPLPPYARTCRPLGTARIYAKELTKETKVFNDWDLEKYMYGGKGDYIALRADDRSDVYIINRSIFQQTYRKI